MGDEGEKRAQGVTGGVRLIDIHAHCVRDAEVRIKGFRAVPTPDELLRIYDRLGVEKGVILPLATGESVGTQSNEEVLYICRAHPDRLVPFCNIDPRNDYNGTHQPMRTYLEEYIGRGCKGLGLLCANLPVNDPQVTNLVAAAEALDLPVIARFTAFRDRSYGLVDTRGLADLDLLSERFPRLRLLCHGRTFWCEISAYSGRQPRLSLPSGTVKGGRLAELLRKRGNIMCDLSADCGANAIMRDRAYGARFLTEFRNRVLFGLDADAVAGEPPLAAHLRSLVDAGELGEAVFADVMRGNAARLLGGNA